MSIYLSGTNKVPLSTIFEPGTTGAVSGYPNLSVRTTTFTNSKPNPTFFQKDGTDLANNYTASVTTYNTNQTVTKPTNANTLRYVIVGGSGGGAGGGGGGINKYEDDHCVRGFDGWSGDHGYITYGSVSVSTASSVVISIGAKGIGGLGGDGRVNNDGPGYDTYYGIAGGDGGTSLISVGGSNFNAPGGKGGARRSKRRIVGNYGYGHSFKGFATSTSSSLSTSGNGTSVYGTYDSHASGNVQGGQDITRNNTLDGSYENVLVTNSPTAGGDGGQGGWGYSYSSNHKGATSGANGLDGVPGKVSLMWLF